MADYWKSNPRKYCEVCKCWMADNKISVQNHESGLRHKGNVEKKMNELQRNNKNAELEKQKLQENIQKINDSAFVGMMKDLARDPSLAKRYGVVLTDELQKQVSEQSNQPNIKRESKKSTEKSAAPKHPVCEWRESTAPDGRKYYWNVNTLATQWTRPEGVVAEEVVSVKEEKNRLQQFVFNRLVELSESGAEGATAAVCQAFNAASEPDEKGSSVASSGENEGFKNESLSKEAMKFEGPKMDLLGQWVPVEDVPPPKLPKLDLPGEKKGRMKSKDGAFSEVEQEKEQKIAVLTHLEETNEACIREAKHLEVVEKCLPSGALSKPLSHSAPEVDNDSTVRSAPRLVFRKGRGSSINRSFRAHTNDD